jgi:CBS domain-containing protein/anti-sigma regulatory factor (Ser/Thr protein kinase)
MTELDLNSEQSPLMILDIVFKTSVRDIMATDIVTAPRTTTMRELQQIMKVSGLTGVPIAEDGLLYGIVTIDNLFNSITDEKLDAPVTEYMVSRLVTLEDDMPLSFAISYFNKYPFRRFPVVDKAGMLVGIITTRDINVSLLSKLFSKLRELEAAEEQTEVIGPERMRKVYRLYQHDFENAGKASTEIKAFLQKKGVPSKLIRRVAVAAYELEINIVAHSEGGTLTVTVTDEFVRITCQDCGPGINNIESAMTEGFSTANDWVKSLGFGAGMGLPNIKRVSDVFEIKSIMGAGTTVKSCIYLKEQKG